MSKIRSLKTVSLSFVLLLAATAASKAQVTIDVSKVSCEQFALYKVASPETLAIWVHGYYSGKRGNTLVDVEALKANMKRLRDYCVQNPEVPLLDAVDTLVKD